jgi:hypothetical protein
MSCPLRPKRRFWLFFIIPIMISQDHEWEVLGIGKHIPGVSNHFKVLRKCEHCQKIEKQSFVSYESLIRMGYTPDQLHEFSEISL